MRVTIRQTPALLVAALAGACASRAPGPRTTAAPTSPALGSAPTVAAHAGTVFTFRASPNGEEAPVELRRMHVEMRQLFGIDIAAPHALARVGADPSRPVVVSWAIVDPAELQGLLSSPKAPARNTPFKIRSQIVLPVVDVARAGSALDELSMDPSCARATGEPARWSAALARLEETADRRAAGSGGIGYFCRGEFNASVARFDAARRELLWVAAVGSGALLAEAAAPITPDRALAERLQREGFFTAGVGAYATPSGEARLYTATGLIKIEAGISGIDPGEMRDRIWRQGVKEITATSRLVDGEPHLFTELRIADRVSSWTLTDAGRRFFASLQLAGTSDAEQLRRAIIGTLKPTGLFADPNALVQSIHEAGSGAFMLIHHFLWPYALVFAASIPPDAIPSVAADWTGAGGMVEIDAQAGVVRAYADAWK
jgi:hypothetical protein